MKYSKATFDMLDKVVERLKKENEIINYGNSNLEKYVSNYILDSMLQYKENASFEMNLTEKNVIDLYNYNEKNNLLKDIIQFIYTDTDEQYPLVLDYWICYEMIIDFCNNGIVECLNCGNIFYHKGRLNVDENGLYTQCEKCNATFDIR